MAVSGMPPNAGRPAVRVAVVSSVHRWNDTRVYLKQARSLVAAGYDVILVAVAPEHEPFESGGVRVLPLPRRRRALRWLNWLSILRAAIRHRSRIVHAHDPELFPMLIMMRLFGIRVVCDVHEDLAQQILYKEWIPRWLRGALSRTVRAAQRQLPRLVNEVILAEDSYLRDFRSAANVTVVRNFPLLPPIHKKEYRTELLRLMYVGDVRIVRGIETCIRLTHSLIGSGIPAELRVVGSFASADEDRRMGELVDQLGMTGRVKWLGRRPPEEVPQLLSDCDVGLALLYPIGNYRESYPTKMFEYMAAGLPVLASNFALWEAVLAGNDCGRVVDPLNVEAAATLLGEYWGSLQLRQRHGLNGRRAVEQHYQWEVELQRLLKLYSGLC